MLVTMQVHEPLGRTRGAAIVMAPCRSRKAEDTRRRQRGHGPLCCGGLSVLALHVRWKITDTAPQEHVMNTRQACALACESLCEGMEAEALLFPLFHTHTR